MFNKTSLIIISTSVSLAFVLLFLHTHLQRTLSQSPTSVLGATTWYTNYRYRKHITISHTKISTDLTNFPVLINLSNDNDLKNNAQSSGNDIVFTDATGQTKLNHEIEKYTSGALIAWVKVPFLSASSDTTLYMYYGNAATGNQQNLSAVWDSTYVSVQHLAETSGTSAPDATSYANTGIKVSAANPNPTSGQIGGAESFNGSSDFITLANGYSDFTNGLTLEVWVYPTVANGWQRFFDIGNGEAQQSILFGRNNGTADISFETYVNGTGSTGIISAASAIALNQWQHFVVTLDTSRNVTIYKNGASVSTGIQKKLPDNITRTSNFLGKSNWGDPLYQGIMDEARVSNVTRTAGWIATEYNNQNAPSAFYAMTAQESYSLPTPTPTNTPTPIIAKPLITPTTPIPQSSIPTQTLFPPSPTASVHIFTADTPVPTTDQFQDRQQIQPGVQTMQNSNPIRNALQFFQNIPNPFQSSSHVPLPTPPLNATKSNKQVNPTAAAKDQLLYNEAHYTPNGIEYNFAHPGDITTTTNKPSFLSILFSLNESIKNFFGTIAHSLFSKNN